MQTMDIHEAIEKNKRIRIQAYSVSDTVEEKVKEVLNLIFTKYGRPELLPPVYTCLKELLINAVKANFKNIYFEDYSPKNEADKIIDYNIALQLFKLEMSRENARHLERLAKSANLKAEITIHAYDNNLFISVTNPVSMTETEMRNVEKKLRDARLYNDLSEYFLENGDGSIEEGAGLGIILISMMLRNLGVEEKDFIITSENNLTRASLKIPLGQGIPSIA